MKDIEVSDKTFSAVIKMLLKDKKTKEIYDKTFSEKTACQLKK